MKKLTPLGVRRKKRLIAREFGLLCQAKARLVEQTRELYERCPHENKTQQRDPSGGNDHAFTCLDCGKEW